MGCANAPVALGSATCVKILATLDVGPVADILAIDLGQTIWTSALDAAPGTIAQLRTASLDLVRYADPAQGSEFFSCVTESDQIAGPKPWNIVDAVLCAEGERGHHFPRAARGKKPPARPTRLASSK